MIILDTNVVSEPMKPSADPSVVAWLDRQAIDTLYLTATSLAELLVDVEVLPNGLRKDGLGAALTEIISSLFGMRVLPFDQRAATTYASLISRARSNGHSISMADGQIAAIAFANGFSVATRDSAPFLAAGVQIVNPWRE